MTSAFVRRQPLRRQELGTRPGLHGQVLVSCGVAGLDTLLGGGLPLGCILLLLEDSQSSQHLNLLRCFMAEGVACGHSVAWVAAQQLSPEGIAAFLPDQARPGSSSSSGSGGASSSQVPSSQQQGGSTASNQQQQQQPEDGLKIAWQYRKYIQQQQRQPDSSTVGAHATAGSSSSRVGTSTSNSSNSSSAAAKAVAAGIAREWCHSYDLSRSLTPAQLAGCRFEACHCCHSEAGSAVQAASRAATAFVGRFQQAAVPVPSRDPASIGRLVIQSFGGPDWWPSSSSDGTANSSSSSWPALEASILQAVAQLRLQIQDTSCAAVITCPAGLFSESFVARLQHLGDAVLGLTGLADDSELTRLLPDPASASALLEVRRLPHLGLLRQRFVDERLHLMRHKRRSISVAPLDLLPLEALEAGGSSSSTGAAAGDGKQQGRPAAAKICGSGPGGGGSALDF